MLAKSFKPPADNTASSIVIPESSLNSPGFNTYPEILNLGSKFSKTSFAVSYTHLRAHETS